MLLLPVKVVLLLCAMYPLVTAEMWIQFCDDTACSANCGISVSVNDPGCLANEWGRNSLKIHGSNFVGAFLVHSPDKNCGCQDDCTEIQGTGAPTCIDISKQAPSQSYRFQLTTCIALEGGSGVGNNCKPSNSEESWGR
ncbi:hypothetical protein F5B20DRAFT_498457 [Whalleya microplaca]|nr:hypothetical protein F5B20DRAFT_498457 [Whalleya microplaca]